MTKKDAKEGTLIAFYTLKSWFVKVKQAYDIDKVKFSFVKKGEHGEGFDIYVDMDDFDNLCDEILSGQFAFKLDADNGPYPQAWKYVTGENGSKSIVIGKGKSQPIVIQGSVKGEGSAFIGVAKYDELRTMAKWFRRSSKAYIEEMCDLINKAEIYRPKDVDFTSIFTTTGVPKYVPQDGYYIPVRLDDGSNTVLYVTEKSLPKLGNWKAFIEDISKMPIRFSMRVKKINSDYLFLDQLTVLH